MHQHPVRPAHFQHRVNRRVEGGGQRVERLVRRHHIKGVIGLEIEQIEHLLQHALVLASDADLRVNSRFRRERFDQRCHLDGFRAGTEDREDFNPGILADDGAFLAQFYCAALQSAQV